MNIYSIALFFHIVGMTGLFLALGFEWIGLRQLRSAVLPDRVRTWMGILRGTNKFGFPCMLATVITGFFMVLRGWGWTPWILVTLGALVLVILLSLGFSRPRMAAAGKALAAGKGTVSQTFHALVNHPILYISIQTRIAVALGIVLLKIARPDLVGSLLSIGVAAMLGILTALPLTRRERAPQGSAD